MSILNTSVPSNFTIEEILKYANLGYELRDKLTDVVDSILSLQEELRLAQNRIEVIEEDIYFRDEFIKSVLVSCDTTTKHKDLVQEIKLELENSYIEL